MEKWDVAAADTATVGLARTAGAGEMWLYHKSGGKGRKMTKRASDQKDSGEPAVSRTLEILADDVDRTLALIGAQEDVALDALDRGPELE